MGYKCLKRLFLKSVISESIDKVLKTNFNKIWTFIPYDSIDKYVGIEVLKELKIKADFCFDSLHTLDHLFNEVKVLKKYPLKILF